MNDEDDAAERHRREWNAARERHTHEMYSNPAAVAEEIATWATLQLDQRAWQAQTERELAQGSELAQIELDNEWRAVSIAQAIEMGGLSPAAVERIRQALATRDLFDATTRGEIPQGEADYMAIATELSSSKLFDSHLGWLHWLQGEIWPDARWRAYRAKLQQEYGEPLDGDGDKGA